MSTNLSLNRQAFIYNGSINENIATFSKLITEFLALNRGNNRELLIRITSSGGVPEQIAGLCGLLTLAQSEGHKVTVHVLGQLCSFTYLVASVADKVVMEPSASLVFGQFQFIKAGNIFAIKSYIQAQQKMYTKLVDAIIERSNGKLDEATIRSWKAKHLTAQEAFELGLCDVVLDMPSAPIERGHKTEHVVHMNGAFGKDGSVYDLQISLHNFLENQDHDGRPIKVLLTSWGGTVVQALSLYGLLCEAQRMGHHVTIIVLGEAYSCALWFPTCALKAGTVLIQSLATLMFHAPSTELDCDLNDAPDVLSVEFGVYRQTCELLQLAPGFTPELLKEIEQQPDWYITAKEAVGYGLGKLFTGRNAEEASAQTEKA
ncbi:MAG: ATP-dependent Clp protease proteolytic subunit [Cyanobacteria bacterium SZAS LIN-3]|nr:ATP-dependent Clp protease proteolytic subunit [Cyanobacteria bacterium SZAS LIN-3]